MIIYNDFDNDCPYIEINDYPIEGQQKKISKIVMSNIEAGVFSGLIGVVNKVHMHDTGIDLEINFCHDCGEDTINKIIDALSEKGTILSKEELSAVILPYEAINNIYDLF